MRSAEEVSTFSLGDLLTLFRANWLFILLSLLICLALGFLYIQSSTHQYSRSASLLIKSESSINSAIETVSYTHLDVYKRQLLTLATVS